MHVCHTNIVLGCSWYRRHTGKTRELYAFVNLKYSSWNHRYGMNNDLYYGMDACCKTINGIFHNLLSKPMKMPGNRANPRLKFTKKTQYKDRYIHNIFHIQV